MTDFNRKLQQNHVPFATETFRKFEPSQVHKKTQILIIFREFGIIILRYQRTHEHKKSKKYAKMSSLWSTKKVSNFSVFLTFLHLTGTSKPLVFMHFKFFSAKKVFLKDFLGPEKFSNFQIFRFFYDPKPAQILARSKPASPGFSKQMSRYT